MPTSRSVVVRRSCPASAWIRTLERIGRVDLELTTFCTVCKPARNVSLEMLNLIRVVFEAT
jgi:hypothetical protein